MILSILICHIFERKQLLDRLLGRLLPQIGFSEAQLKCCSGDLAVRSMSDGKTEVVILADERGGLSIGTKRNHLLQLALGKMVCFVDDDDLVSENMVERILGAIASKADLDVVGMEGVLKRLGRADEPFYHSIKYPTWYSMGNAHFRSPNHLNPVRTELARKVGFPDGSNHGEDHEFSKALHPLLKHEIVLEGPIYFYECAK